jgi:hypothetical protein
MGTELNTHKNGFSISIRRRFADFKEYPSQKNAPQNYAAELSSFYNIF